MYRLYQNSPLSSHPVVALAELSTLCANSCPDERTFYLVLLQLQKEKRVTVLEQNGEKVREVGRVSPRACHLPAVGTMGRRYGRWGCVPTVLPPASQPVARRAAVMCAFL